LVLHAPKPDLALDLAIADDTALVPLARLDDTCRQIDLKIRQMRRKQLAHKRLFRLSFNQDVDARVIAGH